MAAPEITQCRFNDLAHGVAGKGIDQFKSFGQLVAGDLMVAQVSDHVRKRRWIGIGRRHCEHPDLLAEVPIGEADRCALHDGGMVGDGVGLCTGLALGNPVVGPAVVGPAVGVAFTGWPP